jgi:prepilin-type N-terminal cleavage/methylation domain-containing protein
MRKLLNESKIGSSGYTIIEMLVVMVIISITVAFAAPNFNKIIGAYQLDISAREMASNIRDLQQTAIKTQNAGLAMEWHTGLEEYYLKNENIVSKAVRLPNGIDIDRTDFGANKMFIGKNGRPTSVGTIFLKDSTTGRYKYVIVNKLGRVRVSETPPG